MNEQRNELFESAPIPRAVARMGIPTVLSMLVVVIYNMADTFFVGQTKDPNQVAAVSVAMPVFLICMAFGNMFGIGGSSFISRLLGENRPDRVKHVSSFCVYGSLAAGVVLMGLYFMGRGTLLPLIGASQSTFALADQYLTWIAVGAPFIVLSNALGNVVRAEGAARESMVGNMIGTVVNIVLDPIMILSMGMGVTGAAVATVIGNIAATAYYVLYMTRRSKTLSILPRDFRAGGSIARGVIGIGLPASVNTLLMSVSNMLLNRCLVSYGDAPVAAMGVAMKANMLVIFLQMGLAMGVQPLIGYSYGAKNKQRLRGVVQFSSTCTVVMGIVLTAAYWLASGGIISVFIPDADVLAYGVPMLRALMISGPIIGVMFVLTNALQAMNQVAPSLVLSLSRQGLLFLPLLLILGAAFGLDGLVYAQPVADYGSTVLAGILFAHCVRKIQHQEEDAHAALATAPIQAE